MANASGLEKASVFAEEDFIVEAQIFLHNLMEKKGLSRADLARAMGVTRARVTQIFSDECTNLTVRLLARAVYALGEVPELRCKTSELQSGKAKSASMWATALFCPEDLQQVWQIKDMMSDIRPQHPCNDDAPSRLIGHPVSQLQWEAA